MKKDCGQKLRRLKKETITSSDEQDAQKMEEEEGGVLLTFLAEMLNIGVESDKMAGSSDWSGRGSRCKGHITMSTSSGVRLDE